MKNILGILGAVSFVISGSLLGATVFSVMWLKNPENQEKIKSKVVDLGHWDPKSSNSM